MFFLLQNLLMFNCYRKSGKMPSKTCAPCSTRKHTQIDSAMFPAPSHPCTSWASYGMSSSLSLSLSLSQNIHRSTQQCFQPPLTPVQAEQAMVRHPLSLSLSLLFTELLPLIRLWKSCDGNYFYISFLIDFKFCICICYMVHMCVT